MQKESAGIDDYQEMFDWMDMGTPVGMIRIYPQEGFVTTWLYNWRYALTLSSKRAGRPVLVVPEGPKA